jgi:predicted DNA-binding protein YlxM (UPF0122 family)
MSSSVWRTSKRSDYLKLSCEIMRFATDVLSSNELAEVDALSKMLVGNKKEKENMLANVGIKLEYGEPLHEGEYRGTFRTVSDKEHAEIIKLYIEDDLSIDKIAKQLNRSSRTPLVQINKHNAAVERSGFCPSCRRTRSEYEEEIAKKMRARCD